MTDNGNGIWSITIVPEDYFGLNSSQASSATSMGMVFRNEDGTQELKDQGCSDFFINVGSFQVELINPDNYGIILVDYNGSTQILAQNTNGNANYILYANGELVDSEDDINFYNGYQFNNLIENQYCELHISQGDSTIIKKFTILVNNTTIESLPSGLEDGINYNGQIELAHGVNVFNCQALELIKPEVGKFILFPNYMLHTVYPFYGPGERRSFSFNADIAIKK